MKVSSVTQNDIPKMEKKCPHILISCHASWQNMSSTVNSGILGNILGDSTNSQNILTWTQTHSPLVYKCPT